MWYSALIRKSSPSIPPFIVNVTNFTDYKKLNAEYYSAPFYSSSNGYKMQVKIYANGYGKCKGTHVSVCVYIMKGKNDETLKWPFTGDISIHLLNWREDNRHVKRIIPFNNITPLESRSKVIKEERAPDGFGVINFISQDELGYNSSKNTEYVNSDTLCFLIGNVFIPTGNMLLLHICVQDIRIYYWSIIYSIPFINIHMYLFHGGGYVEVRTIQLHVNDTKSI